MPGVCHLSLRVSVSWRDDHARKDIAEWIRQQVTIAAARGLVVGLTGGLDSAVVARLCAAGDAGQVICAIMPCHGDPAVKRMPNRSPVHCDMPVVRLDLTPAYDHLAGDLQAMVRQLRADDAGRGRGTVNGPRCAAATGQRQAAAADGGVVFSRRVVQLPGRRGRERAAS